MLMADEALEPGGNRNTLYTHSYALQWQNFFVTCPASSGEMTQPRCCGCIMHVVSVM